MDYNLEFDVAHNGLEALNLFESGLKRPCQCPEKIYKLIIMDIQMPVMDGKESAKRILELLRVRRIQSDYKLDGTNIVFLTSYTNNSYVKAAAKMGVREVFNKPLSKEILTIILQTYYYN